MTDRRETDRTAVPSPLRRTVLRRAAATGSTLALGTAAGCLSSLPSYGQRIRYGEIDVPEPDHPEFRDWIPAPSAIEHADADWNLPVYAEPATIATGPDGIRPGTEYARLKSRMDYLGVGFDAYDWAVSVGPVTVCRGSFDAASVIETIRETGYERIGSYDGYDLFERTDLEGGVAVRDETVLFRHPGREPGDLEVDDLEAVIDVGAGRRRRRHEVDAEFDAVTREIGAYPAVQFTEFDAFTASELAAEFDFQWAGIATIPAEEYVYYRAVQRYETPVSFSERRVKDVLVENQLALDADRVDVTVDGHVVRIDMRESHDHFLERVGGPEATRYPQITWTVEFTDDGLAVTHAGGDPVDADLLTCRYERSDGDASPFDAQFADAYDVVEPGDSLALTDTGWTDGETLGLMYSPLGSNDGSILLRVALD